MMSSKSKFKVEHTGMSFFIQTMETGSEVEAFEWKGTFRTPFNSNAA